MGWGGRGGGRKGWKVRGLIGWRWGALRSWSRLHGVVIGLGFGVGMYTGGHVHGDVAAVVGSLGTEGTFSGLHCDEKV